MAPAINGSNGCGPVCSQSQFSVELVFELEAGSGSLEDQCYAIVLEKTERLCFSSLFPQRQGIGKSAKGQGNFSADHITVADTAMVSNTTTVVHSNSSTSSSVIRFTKNRLPSVAWKVSDRDSLAREFQAKLPRLSRSAGEKGPEPIISRPGETGPVGVVKGRLIHLMSFWILYWIS